MSSKRKLKTIGETALHFVYLGSFWYLGLTEDLEMLLQMPWLRIVVPLSLYTIIFTAACNFLSYVDYYFLTRCHSEYYNPVTKSCEQPHSDVNPLLSLAAIILGIKILKTLKRMTSVDFPELVFKVPEWIGISIIVGFIAFLIIVFVLNRIFEWKWASEQKKYDAINEWVAKIEQAQPREEDVSHEGNEAES